MLPCAAPSQVLRIVRGVVLRELVEFLQDSQSLLLLTQGYINDALQGLALELVFKLLIELTNEFVVRDQSVLPAVQFVIDVGVEMGGEPVERLLPLLLRVLDLVPSNRVRVVRR